MKHVIVIATFLYGALFGVAAAQTLVINSETNYFVQTSNGEPIACGFEFTKMLQEPAWAGGAVAGITGGITWSVPANGNIGLFLKVGGADFPDAGTAKGAATARPFKIENAFLSKKDSLSLMRPFRRYQCDVVMGSAVEKNQFCGLYYMPESADLGSLLLEGALVLSFNRGAGDIDISVPLSGRIEDITHRETFAQFIGCWATLLEGAKQKLGQK